MNKQKGFISGSQEAQIFIIVFTFGVLTGFALFVGIPWFWILLKPFIHGLTA